MSKPRQSLILVILLSIMGCSNLDSYLSKLNSTVHNLERASIELNCKILLNHEGLRLNAKDYNNDKKISDQEKIQRVQEFVDLCIRLFKAENTNE